MSGKRALVLGATGVVGRRIAEHLSAEPGWTVVGTSRTPRAAVGRVQHLAVDLTDAAACRRALGGFSDVTHIFFAARYDHVTTAPEPIGKNLDMLGNVLDAVLPIARRLEHVHLVHGMKVYGATLGPFKTPAKESDPRVLASNFYYAQEDLIRERQAGQGWSFSTSRPQGVCDADPTIARSLPKLICVYAAICRELDVPFSFPGSLDNYKSIYQCTDSAHLARAVTWISTNNGCGNEAFNVTNGDFFRWMNLWPAFAQHFDLEMGPPKPLRLGDVMQDKGPVWRRIVERHGLRDVPWEKVALWPYGDFIFGTGYDQMSDLTKLRSHGFHDVVDTERMFLQMFDTYRQARAVP